MNTETAEKLAVCPKCGASTEPEPFKHNLEEWKCGTFIRKHSGFYQSSKCVETERDNLLWKLAERTVQSSRLADALREIDAFHPIMKTMEDYFGAFYKVRGIVKATLASHAQPTVQPEEVTDTKLLDFVERQAKESRIGVSFDYVNHSEDGYAIEKGFRFMRWHFCGEPKKDLRTAIKSAMEERT